MAEQPATSILELLTYPNPAVVQLEPETKTNTRSHNYHFPRLVTRWTELESSHILARVFGGQLLREAERTDRTLPAYPALDPDADCTVCDEPEVKDLITKWNKSIVTAGLRPIHQEFKPVIWRKGRPRAAEKKIAEASPPRPARQRTQPSRTCAGVARTQRKKRRRNLSKLRPDSGSIAWDSPSNSECEERFPKEIKPAKKWKSRWLRERELIDESGNWTESGAENDNSAWPVRQAFTYCVQNMCRYGCILTCEEGFFFEVGPIDERPADASENPDLLRHSLSTNGYLKYISVPWDNHCHGQACKWTTWTVNLALWFFHILAGTSHAVDWDYYQDKVWVAAMNESGRVGRDLGCSAVGAETAGTRDTLRPSKRKRAGQKTNRTQRKRQGGGYDSDNMADCSEEEVDDYNLSFTTI